MNIKNLLENPLHYNGFVNILGDNRARTVLVRDFIKPFPKAKILDVGCGPGEMINYLPSDIDYTGYDMNAKYIDHAKKRHPLKGSFFCCSVENPSKEANTGPFDFILAIAILHHLNDESARLLLESASNQLKEGGILVTFDCAFTDNQSKIARYIISNDRGKFVRSPEQYKQLAEDYFSKTEESLKEDLLRIPYTHYIMRCIK